MLESKLEHKGNRFARKTFGIKSRKMNGLGFRGWPDRLYPLPNGRCFWVEWKKPGHRDDVTPNQAGTQKLLRRMGQDVEIHDDLEQFQSSLRRHYRAALDSKRASSSRR